MNQCSITLITYLNNANAACKLWLLYAIQNDAKMTTMAHKLLICDAIVIESKQSEYQKKTAFVHCLFFYCMRVNEGSI